MAALAAACWGVATPSRAQDDPSSAVLPQTPAGEDAQKKLEELQAQAARAEASASEWKAKADEYQSARLGAPERLRQIEAEIARLQKPASEAVDPDLVSEQIELRVLGVEQDLTLAQRELAELNEERDRRSTRRRELPDALADAKARLSALPPATAAPVGEDAESLELGERLDRARRAAIEAEIRALEEELLSYDARGQLLERRIERAGLRVKRGEEEIERLRVALSRSREREAQREAERALALLRDADSLSGVARDVVRGIAQDNAQLARDRYGTDGLLESIADVSRKLNNVDRRIAEVEADRQRLDRKVESAGLTDSVGLLLRRMRAEAPDVGLYRRYIRMRQQEIAAVEERQDQLREELGTLSDIDRIVELGLQSLGDDVKKEERQRFEALLRDLLETKRKHLEALVADNEVYFQKLVDFDARQQELVEKTEALLLFIDQRILWIPSGDALRPKMVRDGIEALKWLAEPRWWQQLGRALIAALVGAWLLNFCVAVIWLGGLVLRRRLDPRLRALAEQAGTVTQTDVAPTLEALALTVVLSCWLPLAVAYVGWRLEVSPDATQFVRCFAGGLVAAGLIWLTIELPRQILRCHGLAVAHFGWPAQAVRALRRDLTWITGLAVALVFVIQLFEIRGEPAWRESIGRVSLIALLLALTVFSHRALREQGALRVILRASDQLGLQPWTWRLVHAVAIGVPLALAVAAARGYYWTALQLSGSYHLTLVFLFLLFALLHLALRWALLARRRLAFDQWRKTQGAEGAERAEPSDEGPVVEQPELDLATVDAQTGRLLSTSAVVAMVLGLWFLWVGLVPAVGILDGFDLWNTTEIHSVETRSADGVVRLHSEEHVVPVTLGDLLVAVLIGFMTLVLVRNLPGMLEISLFRRLGTGPGERYAIASIAKYAITLIGGVLAFNAVGVGWSNIQWLVAAVGLGLGFGLQEIFANFVSGLIILFERPIRVGDTVTVGNLSGTVSKIRIRATWITGFDRKELVVPNKEFVTNQLVNWSLSDPILRVDVPVGIAYGSDTEAAMRELLAVASANEHVLAEPKPQVYFLGFGDSALNFELRCYSPDVERRLTIVHQLHLAVDRAFRAAGIEIAFPQRDVHIRSAPPERGDPGSGGAGEDGSAE